MAISKTQRWLDLIAFLVKRRFPVAVEDIMEGVPAYAAKWRTEEETARATVRRMFERDKDELRAAGIPLATKDYRVDGVDTQGYVLAERDFYLPYLRIVGDSKSKSKSGSGSASPSVDVTAEEAQLAMDALRRVADLPGSPFAAEARTALAKLQFDLQPPAEAPSEDETLAEPAIPAAPGVREAVLAPAPVVFADGMDTGGVREVLRLITDALRARKRVRFRYHGIHRGQATDRDVAPYGLLYQHGHWYLIGHDATREAIRVFRLGRMEDARVEKGDGPEFEPDPGFTLSDYARREPWELGDDEPIAADVRFEFPLSLWAERNDRGEEVRRLTGGAVVRRFAVRQTDPFLRWLQSFGGDAIVTAPEELRRAQAELARVTMDLYPEAHG